MAARQDADLRAALDERAAKAEALVVDYRALPAYLAIVLQALARAYPGKLAARTFTLNEIAHLVGGSPTTYLVTRLLEAGVLSIDYGRSPSGAFQLKGDTLSYWYEKVRYFLIPDLGDDDVEIDDEDDDTFLPDEEEEDDDVADIIGVGGEDDDEI